MAFQLSHPQGKMYKAARRRYLFLFLETANPLKGCWCLERECLWAEMGKKEGGLGWGGGKMELGGGALNRRKGGGGRECVFDSKKGKKSQFGPPVLCRTFSFDPPLLSLLPPTTTTTTPPNSYTHTHRHTGSSRSAGYHTSEPFLSSAQRCTLLNIYLHCIVCVHVHTVATGRHWGRREGNGEREWQEGREGGIERGRVRVRLK